MTDKSVVVSFPHMERKTTREVYDPCDDPKVKQLVSDFYCFDCGGIAAFKYNLGCPIKGREETDILSEVRYRSPRIMFALQPVVAAWSRDERCDLEYVKSAALQHCEGELIEFLLRLHYAEAITVNYETDQNCEQGFKKEYFKTATFLPTRRYLYRLFEMFELHNRFWQSITEDHTNILKTLRSKTKWRDHNAQLFMAKKGKSSDEQEKLYSPQ